MQSSSLLQASSELGERRYNSGYLNYKSGHLCYNSAPESYKSGHSFYKTAVQATETPELCPVFNERGTQRKITLSKTNALRTPHRSSQRVQEFSLYMSQMLAFVSIFFSTTQENSSFLKTLFFVMSSFDRFFSMSRSPLPFVLPLPKSTERAQKRSVRHFYIKSVKLPPRKQNALKGHFLSF